MEKLRIVIDPSKFPGKTEVELRQMVQEAEVLYVTGLDPIGQPVGEIRALEVKPAMGLLEDMIKTAL